MSKHHPDLIMCRRQPGIAMDAYVRRTMVNETLVRICDGCNYGTYGGQCIICNGPGVSDAYYCAACTRLEKDRDGCPKVISLGTSRTHMFYKGKRLDLNGWI